MNKITNELINQSSIVVKSKKKYQLNNELFLKNKKIK